MIMILFNSSPVKNKNNNNNNNINNNNDNYKLSYIIAVTHAESIDSPSS